MVKARSFRGTNIEVKAIGDRAVAPPTVAEDMQQHLVALHSIQSDDEDELRWINRLRPARALIHPSELFAQSVKKLRPAVDFNTYDAGLAKARRVERREDEQRRAQERRALEVAPTAAMKAALDPRKMLGDNHLEEDLLKDDVTRALMSGKKRKHLMEKVARKKKTQKLLKKGGRALVQEEKAKAKQRRENAKSKREADTAGKRPMPRVGQKFTNRVTVGDEL